jgi:hypothetical protein
MIGRSVHEKGFEELVKKISDKIEGFLPELKNRNYGNAVRGGEKKHYYLTMTVIN